jgi:hypothetical protein
MDVRGLSQKVKRRTSEIGAGISPKFCFHALPICAFDHKLSKTTMTTS